MYVQVTDPCEHVCAGNIPMFPRDLADELFSLRAGQPTAAMSVHITLNSEGMLEDCGLVASTITPTRKLTYSEVDELLEVTMPEQEPTLWALNKVWPSAMSLHSVTTVANCLTRHIAAHLTHHCYSLLDSPLLPVA